MFRTFSIVVAHLFIGVTLFATTPAQAQTDQTAQLPTATPSTTTTATPNVGIAGSLITTVATATVPSPVLPTPTPISQASTAVTTADLLPAEDDGPLQGTIITNRSTFSARFFLEGSTYLLPAGIARGFQLPRQTSVVNLYNCAADVAESTTCFWDPYLIENGGLYDIFDAPGQGGATKLLLQDAGSPPTDQVWIQNRTGHQESIVFQGDVHELPATALVELPVAMGAPAILYVRHCLSLDGQSVCEWTPKSLEAGAYYALVDNTIAGTVAGSTITTVDLRPVVGGVVTSIAESGPVAPAVQTGSQVSCRLLVPVLNVRSGPGLQYIIIDKIRSEETPAVAVTGRSADGQWLTIDASVASDGWITSSASFVDCEGNISDLPLVEAPPAPEPAPTPVPQPSPVEPGDVSPPATEGESPTEAPQDEPTEEPATETPVVPSGLALLLVNNGFQHDIRVTIDQQYRPLEGPSEYDLPPGASTQVLVFPGSVPFTVSSPWSALSRNALLEVERDATHTLWLRFEADSSGSWYLLWE